MIERVQDENSTISISGASQEVVGRLKEHNLLAIGTGDESTNTKDIYLLAVALGLNSPVDTTNKGAYSYTRTTYFTDEDRALLTAALWDTVKDPSEILEPCNFKKAYTHSKGFTNSGFQIIDQFASESNYDPQLMVQKLLYYVNSIYDETIEQVSPVQKKSKDLFDQF